jgi:predicted CoA-binding protein
VKTIAVLGASTDRAKYGNKCVRAYLHAGWSVLPVNPRATVIEGLPAIPDLAAAPPRLDRISVYLPPPITLALLPAIAAAGAREVWFNPGAADAQVLAAAKRLGIPAIDRCSIVDIGLSPSQFPA